MDPALENVTTEEWSKRDHPEKSVWSIIWGDADATINNQESGRIDWLAWKDMKLLNTPEKKILWKAWSSSKV